MTQTQLDTFTAAYIEAALWSSTAYGSPQEREDIAENGEGHFDQSFQDCGYSVDDIDPKTLAQMIADCAAFQAANSEHITEDNYEYETPYSVEELAGHDFWLNRNGHGAGFWDGDWAEPAASALDAASHAYGSLDLYVGDDGKIYG